MLIKHLEFILGGYTRFNQIKALILIKQFTYNFIPEIFNVLMTNLHLKVQF